MIDVEIQGGRRGGRRRERGAAGGTTSRAARYRTLRNPFTPQQVFTADRVEAIHRTALRVLEELGIKVLLPEGRARFAGAGALVDEDTQMVRIGRDIVEQALSTAPRSIHLRAANPEREQDFRLGTMTFMAGAGCPHATDLVRGRRPSSYQDYEELLKLAQSFDVLHLIGPAAEPQDVPLPLRHYAMMRAQLALCDKPTFVYSRGRGQVADSFEMVRIARGLSEERFRAEVWCNTVINSNSPRQLDMPMTQGIIDFAEAGQMSIITPFCLAGAMAPITVAGALTLQHAEALAGIALAQIVRPGAPVCYGGFSSNVDMKSGSPAFGTPEHIQTTLGAGQLARHVGLPWRSAAGTASNISDAQATHETLMSSWAAVLAGGTLNIHTAGWLEGGLSLSYEKLITDLEALQTFAELCTAPAADDDAIGYHAIADVQPGGPFFSTPHTMERYQTAFYEPLVADWSNFGAWTEAGAKTSTERATGIWQEKLARFSPPPAVAGCDELLAPFIERRTAEGGAAPES